MQWGKIIDLRHHKIGFEEQSSFRSLSAYVYFIYSSAWLLMEMLSGNIFFFPLTVSQKCQHCVNSFQQYQIFQSLPLFVAHP